MSSEDDLRFASRVIESYNMCMDDKRKHTPIIIAGLVLSEVGASLEPWRERNPATEPPHIEVPSNYELIPTAVMTFSGTFTGTSGIDVRIRDGMPEMQDALTVGLRQGGNGRHGKIQS